MGELMRFDGLSIASVRDGIGTLESAVESLSQAGCLLASSDVVALARYSTGRVPGLEASVNAETAGKSQEGFPMNFLWTSDVVLMGFDTNGKVFAAFCDIASLCGYDPARQVEVLNAFSSPVPLPMENSLVGAAISSSLSLNRCVYVPDQRWPFIVPVSGMESEAVARAVFPGCSAYQSGFLQGEGFASMRVWFPGAENLAAIRGEEMVVCKSVVMGGKADVFDGRFGSYLDQVMAIFPVGSRSVDGSSPGKFHAMGYKREG